jgi:hypothetical protein
MATPNEFWLALHVLADAYDAEGPTPDDRAKSIVKQFHDMPHVAQREVMGDLLRVVVHCPELYPQVVAAARKSESEGKIRIAQTA